MNRKIKILLLLSGVLLTSLTGYCQQRASNAAKVAGIVLDADDREELPYVNIRIKGTRYGTASDSNGYFSIFINSGDTLEFSSIGFRDAIFIMPFELKSDQYSLMQLMRKETVLLSEVVVFPWPSIENFEQAFLDARPKRNMDDVIFEAQRDILRTVDNNEKYEYYYDQMRYNRLYELTGEIPPNNFLNPIRWSNFIQDLKTGKVSNKKDNEE